MKQTRKRTTRRTKRLQTRKQRLQRLQRKQRKQRGGDFNPSQYPNASVVETLQPDSLTGKLDDPDSLPSLKSA